MKLFITVLKDAPKGVYMTDTWKVAKMVGQHHGMDVWRVRAKALDEVHPDPDDQGDYGAHSVYTPRKIPPDRISRVQGLGNGAEDHLSGQQFFHGSAHRIVRGGVVRPASSVGAKQNWSTGILIMPMQHNIL